ncbi:UDP-N-acetylglucosamine 2-epimerase [Bermanella sp. WJH001]|uniref:UDP-N-acetylglucosamine 2-epimerase n=1 Tax=Bermanella sp. WJH001 TaxID=3048005 RepID=UPI0024BED61C|nr:UDP-N-acetylglucosamine 2-epimerase [Bermanella sp. WJH001]MDJ1537764.1 UDP-N-acetylglucosamine 2-epimerase [Bermanella sp. WJH001]
MINSVLVFTSTRADYGILYPLLKALQGEQKLQLKILTSGTHLSKRFGNTYQEIEKDGFKIDAKVDILSQDNSQYGVVKNLAQAIDKYNDELFRIKPDLLILLGDRYEALAMAQCAYIHHIPVLHLHGGEVTSGAYDDGFRHSITKLSHYHCVANETYRQRVIQLGEAPDRVFNTGALGIDHIKQQPLISNLELSGVFDFDFSTPFFLITYHPETLSRDSPLLGVEALLTALSAYPDIKMVMTYPNVDHGGQDIIDRLKEFSHSNKNRVLLIESLGHRYYHSVVKLSELVIGNSSSGIIEVPALGVPTINIGTRQQGRLRAKSVIDTPLDSVSIKQAIDLGLSAEFRQDKSRYNNPYGDGHASEKIIKIIRKMNPSKMKIFYDIKVS